MPGFWTARVLTKPFGRRSEKFRSTFFIDFLSSGVIGLFRMSEVVSPPEGTAARETIPFFLLSATFSQELPR